MRTSHNDENVWVYEGGNGMGRFGVIYVYESEVTERDLNKRFEFINIAFTRWGSRMDYHF
jgi:hypothetical protein